MIWFVVNLQSISVVESLATVGNKLEVAIYVGVVVMHVVSLLLHCGGLHDNGQLHDLAIIGHLSVSILLYSVCLCL